MGEPVVTKKKISPWVWGCGIGCGGALLLALIAAIAGYFLVMRNIPVMKEGMVRGLQEQFDRAKNDGKLSPEQQEVFGDLIESCKKPETSIFAMGVAFMLFQSGLNAPEQDRQEAMNAAKDLRDAMKTNSNLGIGDIQRLLEKYPKLGQAFQKGMNDMSRMKPSGSASTSGI